MSEELMGRARGRARGRTRIQQQQQSQPGLRATQPPPSQSEPEPRLPPEARVGRAKALSSSDKLSEKMKAMSLSGGPQGEGAASAAVPSRGGVRTRRFEDVYTKPPGFSLKQGTSGVPVPLRANYFKLTQRTEFALNVYRVDFAPEEDRTVVRKGLLRVHAETLGAYMFDGTVLFTIKKLFPDPLELYSARTSDDARIRITIKCVTDLVAGDANYIQFFNIVIRKCIAGLNLQLVGRDYYDMAMRVKVDKYNLELWPGFITSARQHEKDILLCIDLANKIMRKDTVLNLLSEMSSRAGGEWKKAFLDSIVGCTVLTPYNNKTYRVDDVDFESSPTSTFAKGNEQVSYIDYYHQRYQIKITNTSQPLLVSHPKKKDIRGGRNQNIILIPELCCMTGLTDDMRNNFNLMRELETHTRLAPKQRADRIITFMKRLTTNPSASKELSLWNLKFAPDLVEFSGRMLAPERILHGDNQISEGTSNADWTRNLRGHSLYRCQELNNWSVIYARKMQRDVEVFCRTLSNASASFQFRIPPPQLVDIPDDRAGTYVQAIERVVASSRQQMIMCIVPNNRADRYSAIKKKCYVDRSIPSQVVLSKNVTNKNVMSIATKISIQINCKIGGTPWGVVIPFKKPIMVVGFDVCHDSTLRGNSYGAMVASLDGSYGRYYSVVCPHSSGEELSNEFGNHLTKAVLTFRNYNGFLPKILIYRDGVGEGNEHYVLQSEVQDIRSRLQQVYGAEELQMTFVLVSKRINTRLFANGSNPPPGTIVDDVVTNPNKYDFFLVSQSVRQGTVAPTSFNVIDDTIRLQPDILQKLSFKMTHLYFNWSGTVRVPAPVQYAHKLAYLCGQHLHRQPNEGLNELLYFL